MTLTRVTVALASLGQANGICSTADSAAGSLTHTANSVGRTLQGLAEEANDTSHFLFYPEKFSLSIDKLMNTRTNGSVY